MNRRSLIGALMGAVTLALVELYVPYVSAEAKVVKEYTIGPYTSYQFPIINKPFPKR